MQISATSAQSAVTTYQNPFVTRGAATGTTTSSAATGVGADAPPVQPAAAPVGETDDLKVNVKLKVKVKEGHERNGRSRGRGEAKGHEPRLHVKLKARIGDEKLKVKFKETIDEGTAASLVETLRDEVGAFLADDDLAAYATDIQALLDEFEAAVTGGATDVDGAVAENDGSAAAVGSVPAAGAGLTPGRVSEQVGAKTDIASIVATIEEALARFASGLEAILRGEAPSVDPVEPSPLLAYAPAPAGGAVIVPDRPVIDVTGGASVPANGPSIDVLG